MRETKDKLTPGILLAAMQKAMDEGIHFHLDTANFAERVVEILETLEKDNEQDR